MDTARGKCIVFEAPCGGCKSRGHPSRSEPFVSCSTPPLASGGVEAATWIAASIFAFDSCVPQKKKKDGGRRLKTAKLNEIIFILYMATNFFFPARKNAVARVG